MGIEHSATKLETEMNISDLSKSKRLDRGKVDADKRLDVGNQFEQERADKRNGLGKSIEKLGEKIGFFDKFYSTYEERINQTPSEDNPNGRFIGKRGESKFQLNESITINIPKVKEVKEIPYKNGIPDFSSVSADTVKIPNMTTNMIENFKQAYTELAKKWNQQSRDGRKDWTPKDIRQWCIDNNYTIHECSDTKHCQLVPRSIHDMCGHTGGRFECKCRDNVKTGGFDD